MEEKRGIFSAIFNFLFCPTESKTVKQIKKNMAILMENQNLQQSLVETITKANNIIKIHLVKKRHMIHGLVDRLKA